MTKDRVKVDLDVAVSAARAMIATDGSDALSMRRLAGELGISTMAIYRHIQDRDHLIDLVVDAALADCVPEVPPGSSWQDAMVAYFHRFWSVMTTEPGLGAIAITRPMQGPNMARITDDLLTICRAAGLADHAFVIIDALLVCTFGAIAYDISRPAAARKGIIADETTPELSARHDDYGHRDPNTYFLATIGTVVLGLEERIRRAG